MSYDELQQTINELKEPERVLYSDDFNEGPSLTENDKTLHFGICSDYRPDNRAVFPLKNSKGFVKYSFINVSNYLNERGINSTKTNELWPAFYTQSDIIKPDFGIFYNTDFNIVEFDFGNSIEDTATAVELLFLHGVINQTTVVKQGHVSFIFDQGSWSINPYVESEHLEATKLCLERILVNTYLGNSDSDSDFDSYSEYPQ